MYRNEKHISVCALVPYPLDTTPSQRYRIEQWLPYLKAQGISVDLIPFVDERLLRVLYEPGQHVAKAVLCARAFVRRLSQMTAIHRYDAIYVHRTACLAGPAVLEKLLSLFRQPVIFDFDDAIFLLHTTEANRRYGWLKFPSKTATICRLSTHVVVGNSYLADYACRYNPWVTVIPSSVDTEHYQPVEHNRSRDRVVVGWMGSSTSQTHLEMFAPVLRDLFVRRDIELRIVSDREPHLPGIPYVWHSWSAKSEISELAYFDIGIMPLPDDKWARGKCAMKVLLYMSMAAPVVCSAVGTNCEVIQHGENGFLASTPREWLTHLEALIDDASLRKRLGMAGRQTIEDRYSAHRCGTAFASVIRETVGSKPTSMSNRISALCSDKR